MNVVMVMWGPGAAFPDYPQAVANCRLVSKQVFQLIEKMVGVLGVRYGDLHMIAHSLGAHISGHVGQMLRQRNIPLGRITG